jgi:branched-chain amino acid transport system ATP-binding protein
VLLLDEPLEGLAPVLVDQLLAALDALKLEAQLTILMVEQQAEIALEFAPRAIVLDRGRIVHAGPSAALLADEAQRAAILGVRGAGA